MPDDKPLPPFSGGDPLKRCPKCAAKELDARWCPGLPPPPTAEAEISIHEAMKAIRRAAQIAVVPHCHHGHTGEHMTRTCQRCQYQWHEQPLDAQEGDQDA